MDEFKKWNKAAGGWSDDILRMLLTLGLGINYTGQANGETQSQTETKKQKFCSDVPKNEKELIYGIGPNSIPYEKVLKLTTYTEIQEGEFEEIEDTETGEITII